MKWLDVVVGKPIKTQDERAEQIGAAQGVPIFGLDALSSAAYGPEAALVLLIPLGAAGVQYAVPISAAVIALLGIVYFSYRQTIAAYPDGGGSYTVARANLGAGPSLLAAAALLTDYILTAAVGISAGVGALVSAVPALLPHTLALCLGILAVVTLINLRGIREASTAFAIPTLLFIGTLLATVGVGVAKAAMSGGHPRAVALPPAAPAAVAAVSGWLLLKAFASGCTAITGVEAVSNGVRAFRDPRVQNARRTLTTVIVVLAIMLGGVSYLVRAYGMTATKPGDPGYQSLLSLLVGAVFGRGIFYFLTMASILAVLSLSANTAFADFPRLCRSIAQDNYLPHAFAYRGRRLVYTYGIVALALLCGALLVAFGGVTDRLIPLYAVGAFLAFTLSQTGMVMHWRRHREAHWRKSAAVNGLGALTTAATVAVVLTAKFREGAWITLLFIPLLMAFCSAIQRRYRTVERLTEAHDPVDVAGLRTEPIAVVPIDCWDAISRRGIEFAARLSEEMIAVHVHASEGRESMKRDWEKFVVQPFKDCRRKPPELEVLRSPYRFVVLPVVDFVLRLSKQHPRRNVVVVIPEYIGDRWYEYFLHNQRGRLLAWALRVRGNDHIYTVAAPWYVAAKEEPEKAQENK